MAITQVRPTPTWTLSGLLCLVERYAQVASDRLPLLAPDPTGQPETRSYTLLELTDDVEIWAIHWPSDQGLELHDHGGSAGAFWVVSGELVEHVPVLEGSDGTDGDDGPTRLTRRQHRAGTGTAFSPDHIHGVRNEWPAPASATSIHAYSPPMQSMTFYGQRPNGLVAERTELRFDSTWTP